MLDQSDNLNYHGCVIISDLYFFQGIAFLNPCLIYFEKLILSFTNKVTLGT